MKRDSKKDNSRYPAGKKRARDFVGLDPRSLADLPQQASRSKKRKPEEFGQLGRVSMLQEETGSMEWQRRLEEQQGHRYHLQVQVKEARERIENNAENEQFENNPLQHPWLDKQIFDGADPDVSPEPALNSDARREYDNQKREQEMEKQLRLENQLQNVNQPRYSSAPKPRGP